MRRDFGAFVGDMLVPFTAEPGAEVQWFHQEMIDELQAWYDAEEPYPLILQCPPGHAKSTYAKMLCAWIHANDPDSKLGYFCYASELANTHAAEVQDMVFNRSYSAAFPWVRLNEKRTVTDKGRGAIRKADKHELVGRKGSFQAAGLNGSITGARLDVAIIDDPIKGPEEAQSDRVRDKIWNVFRRVIKTRRRPGRPLRILMILTRWHLDDPAGRLIKRDSNARVVNFEALRREEDHPNDPRAHNQALWPAVVDAPELLEVEREDPEGFSCLYQGNPAPPEGIELKAEWLNHRWYELSNRPRTYYWAMDPKGGSKDPRSSRVVIQLWCVYHDMPAKAYLVDQRRGLWSQPETIEMLRRLNKLPTWGSAAGKWIEAKADGKAIVDTLCNEIPGLEAVEPQGDKVVRLRGVAHYFKAGNVILPHDEVVGCEWMTDPEEGFIAEHLAFPNFPWDDQVDTTTLALKQIFGTVKPAAATHAERLRKRLGAFM